MAQQKYDFQVETQQGAAIISVPLGDFKQCPCGSDLFKMLHRVTWFKQPGVIGATPIRFQAEIYVCHACGREIGPDDGAIKDAVAKDAAAND